MPREDVEEIINKYKEKLKGKIKTEEILGFNPRPSRGLSHEYMMFREDALSRSLSLYENLCNFSERIIKINPKDKEYLKLKKNIDAAHLKLNPEGAASFATLSVVVIIFIGIITGLLLFFISESKASAYLLPLLLTLGSLLILKPLTNIPNYLATRWRLKASNQMVLCILYIVMYMRHTSNLENGLRFAIDHIGNPLALDLRKIFWDIETGKYSTIKESLDSYLVSWRNYNLEFVEAFHLIEGSLLEPSEERRVTILEKSLEVMLNGTYEKMLHYAQELKNPITILHMLGIILPILGLVILPLFGSMLEGSAKIKIISLVLVYNVLLPVTVYFIGTSIMSKRPTGFSEENMMEKNPELVKYQNIIFNIGNREIQFNPVWISIIIGLTISAIGIFPLLIHMSGTDFSFLGSNFIDYKTEKGAPCNQESNCFGPFGVGSVILSLFLPLGIALGFALYYNMRTRKLILIREETKKLELEFSSGLFQLGNRVGDNIPVEVAFGEVAASMQGTPTGNFFARVNANIKNIGVDIHEAVFNKDFGAIWYYPSSLIESVMKVIIETTKRGPQIVSRSLISISYYINRIHEVNERVKDLLSDVISSMKSQISFLTPAIAGIVVGITTMIVNILGRLSSLLAEGALEGNSQGSSIGNMQGIPDLFSIPNIIPSYYLQIIIGLYVVQITIILSFLVNSIENGIDRLSEKYNAAKNLTRSIILYFLIALVVTILFNIMVNSIKLSGIAGS